MVNGMPSVHFHVEARVQNGGQFGDWETIPGGRDVYITESAAKTVAWSFMDLQRDIFSSYLQDHSPEITAGFLRTDEATEAVPLLVRYINPVTQDALECRVERCAGGLVQSGVGEEEFVNSILSAIFGADDNTNAVVMVMGEDGQVDIATDTGATYTTLRPAVAATSR